MIKQVSISGEYIYNTTGLQEIINIAPSNSGRIQVECADDCEYEFLGSVAEYITNLLPIGDLGRQKGSKVIGGFHSVELLQINIITLGSVSEVKMNLILS